MAGSFTISSGSSGKRVMVPEPSRSIFCLMSFIFIYEISEVLGVSITRKEAV